MDATIRRPLSILPPPHSAPLAARGGGRISPFPSNAPVTPRPILSFAIASDDAEQVQRVLESGDAKPDDSVGPTSALIFTLTNDQLTKKLDIVKTLLAFGADPSPAVQEAETETAADGQGESSSRLGQLHPAIRYV
jgi:hypothetical protein